MTHDWSWTGGNRIGAEELKRLVAGGRLEINSLDGDGEAALHRAVDLGAEDVAQVLWKPAPT